MSNKYSIDAEGLAESIRLSAGTLTEAHMSIEQAATMFATANKYYNDPSYLGNTAKIGSLRMRASSGDTDAIEELQEMGEEVDDLATATSNLREKLMALTGVDIMEDEHTSNHIMTSYMRFHKLWISWMIPVVQMFLRLCSVNREVQQVLLSYLE